MNARALQAEARRMQELTATGESSEATLGDRLMVLLETTIPRLQETPRWQG